MLKAKSTTVLFQRLHSAPILTEAETEERFEFRHEGLRAPTREC